MNNDWICDYLRPRLKRNQPDNLSRQLYRQLQELIRTGRLPGNSSLPASRALGKALSLGRNTVLAAYDQLIAEGYLESRHGSGTYVCDAFLAKPPAVSIPRPRQLSARGQHLVEYSRLPTGKLGAFVPGLPELEQFPYRQWQQCLTRQQRQSPLEWLHYQHGGGLPELRAILSQYLYLTRSVRCSPEQLVIASGAQSALGLLAQLLAEPGEIAWLEEPGYSGAQAAMRAGGLLCHPVGVDRHGLQIDPQAPAPRLIYVTPSHQYPTGAVMSLERRLQLLASARQHDSWIIEDDYDSEFCYSANPLAALQGLDQDNRVIYLGTFSKVMFPAMRLAYLVLPPELVDPFRRCQARLLGETSYLQQAAVADFIERGYFARHIRNMRALYLRRQQLLRHALKQYLGDALPIAGGQAGMHLLATLPNGFDEWELQQAAAQQGLWLRPLARHFLNPPTSSGLVLGYAGIADQTILPSVQQLARLLGARLK
ncbi:PLP-dependent aminotransferase family protein [Chromobacterium sphagni]|uniref:Putative 8-amino-7-oxononanoate synthase n=1 Tax=Chromobacterium sphagni TaxID=1903179 RepID=A0A1S1X2X3_9NEIS|nr:PLP-dependent aminotransferase family protein [Chromobacterium sphagni]OHX13758.1 GntR family transcriptional regulator [Chromobacterium sphagni]OHX18134.1 GntR family transcriptional regulator [Chromobacterium sphagni]